MLSVIPEERRKECWWLVLRDGTPIPGDAGGGVRLLAELNLTHPLGTALRVLSLGWFIDTVDKILSRHRQRLGKLVPDGPALRRYP